MIGSLLLLWLAAGTTAPMRANPLPACSAVFDSLVMKTEADYVGFVLEVKGDRQRQYDSTVAALRPRAANAEGERCYFVLAAYIEQFRDPHLFVFQSTYVDTAEIARRAATPGYLRRSPVTEDSARRYFQKNARHLDAIEGIWRDGALRVAVLPAPLGEPGFVAVVLASDTATWHAGDVRARFVRRPDGRYDGALWTASLAKRFTVAHIHKHVLLRFDPGMWAKEYPVAPADSGLVSLAQPHAATLTWRGKTAVLSIPSHDPGYRDALFGLVTAHRAELLAAPKLIIDLRGNEGGSSWVTDTVLPLIMSAPQRPSKDPPDDPQILSSADMRKYVHDHPENFASESSSAVRLIARLEANPGRLVPVEDSIDRARDSAKDAKRPPAALAVEAEAPGPRRVALLIDDGTVSAAEVFLRRARRSTRVTVYGENTAGALDYMSVIIVRIGDTGRRWALGFPTIAARPDLPRGGMRGIGMPPDVRVDWSTVPDAIGYVNEALSK